MIISQVYCFSHAPLQALEEQFPDEEKNITYTEFKFKKSENSELYIEIIPPHDHDHCVIALDPNPAKVCFELYVYQIKKCSVLFQQIRAAKIDFWTDSYNMEDLQLMHEKHVYPPRVNMTVTLKDPGSVFKLLIRFEGCSSDSQLNADITFPLSMCT